LWHGNNPLRSRFEYDNEGMIQMAANYYSDRAKIKREMSAASCSLVVERKPAKRLCWVSPLGIRIGVNERFSKVGLRDETRLDPLEATQPPTAQELRFSTGY
jgi:hypothetical protein